MTPLQEFNDGPPELRRKLNDLVRTVNALMNVRGDGFLRVASSPSGYSHSLNIDQIIARMPKVGGGIGVAWGKATADWGGSNSITLTPCKSQTDDTATGADDIACTVVSPSGGLPSGLSVKSGDILAYIPISEGQGLLYPVATPAICVFVSLEKDGGTTAGSKTTACNYTYTLKDFGGRTLATGRPPRWRPIQTGLVTGEAFFGIASCDSGGAWVLLVAFEVYQTGNCP